MMSSEKSFKTFRTEEGIRDQESNIYIKSRTAKGRVARQSNLRGERGRGGLSALLVHVDFGSLVWRPLEVVADHLRLRVGCVVYTLHMPTFIVLDK